MTCSLNLVQTLRNSVRNLAPVLPALAATAVLVACGGGGTGSPASPPPSPPKVTPKTVFASGPITGFGSVIINGVRFDDSGATIDDEDDGNLTEAQLGLGMEVDVDGDGDNNNAAKGTAHALHVHSALLGPVSAIDTTAGTLTVLGQTVAINAQTVFDTAITAGLGSIAAGAVVRVHGQFDTALHSYVATRIELDADATHYKIRGTLTALDAVAKTLQIGATSIDYSTTTNVPTTLAVGSVIVARLATTPVNGIWTATKIDDGHHDMHDHDEANLHGVISAFTSVKQFSVDGNPVDATNATFPNGQTGIALGATVEVEGQLANGVVIAKDVQLQDESQHDGQLVELHGKISALDTAAMTFVVRGVTVSYAGSVVFDHGTVAGLVNDLFVEVKAGLSANGATVVATSIDLQPAD